jgi:hypothetical protein
MKNYINILEGLFGISAGIYLFLYLTGKLNYSGEKEIKRLEKVKKHEGLFIFCIILLFVCSFGLIFLSI